MARDDYEVIQVVFSKHDPDQQQLFQHVAGRTNRSGYIKRLIQRDMDGASLGGIEKSPIRQHVAPPSDDFNVEGFI